VADIRLAIEERADAMILRIADRAVSSKLRQ
jgi:hypothetical protein